MRCYSISDLLLVLIKEALIFAGFETLLIAYPVVPR
jgi:hypothetical protein